MKRILLIEEDTSCARLMERELRREGFEVLVTRDGKTGLELALSNSWELILLSLITSNIDDIDICQEIRRFRQTPIIIISAKDSVSDRVRGLDCGADDYILKPFAIEELLARIRVVFRRQRAPVHAEQDSVLTCGDLTMDCASRMVRNGNSNIELTKREFALLEAFMKNQNRVLSRETLLDTVWGYEAAVDTNVVDVYVRYIRNKLDEPGESSCIETVRGIGYVMRR